ncbi:ABC transporter ATP-binding protein/permease [Erythrobacter sp. SDW2]|uniref:ABCB family ABC transporter ATP-binding protein/permease n=1 Tax=Erythrobacter sp. SDW2 TaxID=2907154 RepID=UPI001F2DD0D4|nr:ABC transporter ATP-binding protein/permease [Erythrobacter sp. SDW2]UIP06695.1 ABC transporter ATP-binding protein/permease [Erythrobacter sp. SDW2]
MAHPLPTSDDKDPSPGDVDGWGTMRRFIPYLWSEGRSDLKLRIVGALALVLLTKGIILATPLAMKRVVDTMASQGDALLWVALSFVIAFTAGRFLGGAFDQVRNIVFERVGQEATQNLAEDTFQRLHNLSLRFHLSRRTGEVTKIIERGTKSIDTMLYFLLFNIVPTIIELIALGVIFYTLFGFELVLATALTVVVYIALTRWITEWRTALRKRMNDLDGTALARAVDSLLNYETVKYFGAERREQERYSQSAKAYAEAAIKSENSLGLLNMTQSFVMNALMLFALGFTVYQWSLGKLTVGDLVAVQTYLTQLFRPLDMLGFVYRTIRQGLIDMAAMFRLMDTAVEVEDVPGAPALIASPPTIAFEDVVFGYDPDRTILHGLSFEVPAGARVAIVGPSGAGKSTIGRLLFRFYDPQAGRILIAGQDIAKVTQESLREAIGIVPQDSVLFNDTLGYNIAYGRDGASHDDVVAAARDAAILPFIEKLPEGFETQVGERGLKLSGGEKQRVAIARTLLKNPPILLFDEATSALDSRTEQDILATLQRVSRDRTTLAIAHRLSTIADADTILVLNEGRLEEQGRHADLLRKGGLYAEMWARQQAEGDTLVEAAE